MRPPVTSQEKNCLRKAFHKKHVTWRIMEVIPNNYRPRRPSGCVYPPVKCMVGVLSSFWRLPVWSPTGATTLDLKVKQFPVKKVGWVVTILVFTKTTGSGWLPIAQNGCKNSFKSSNTTTSSIQYVEFFGIFNLHKMLEQLLSHLKKKTSAKGPLSALKKSMGT